MNKQTDTNLYATAPSTSAVKASNDQDKKTSKADQQKKDKKVALKIVKEEAR
ncbi:hypothetical protein RO3G_05986 [Rhizopus delemar RA 99-880]|uniref:Uncharacterized protein n=1 Tax=Rhizopus delemar (strain RA 99-880 / ATCC MYA-4621 / FGSC 9543 / NRRL 43880) TaxID=246409 RepID=I1BYK1_RHIO9|nr:hypothetical protein RO3G_05986 [Rhizopus delemar RA 99-880]|eukprot:EIE81281.1 hypothetical protein RO3G_05986 [Rhizopus delemar RA 99-880]